MELEPLMELGVGESINEFYTKIIEHNLSKADVIFIRKIELNTNVHSPYIWNKVFVSQFNKIVTSLEIKLIVTVSYNSV